MSARARSIGGIGGRSPRKVLEFLCLLPLWRRVISSAVNIYPQAIPAVRARAANQFLIFAAGACGLDFEFVERATLASVIMIRSIGLALIQIGLTVADTLSGTSHVYLNQSTGATKYVASGILLGIPLSDTQIPDSFLSTFGFNYIRSGGSQLPQPSRGWTHGELQVG